MSSQPTNATQAKDRLYTQLARNLATMSGAVGRTADLCQLLQVDLDAMKRLGGLHAAQLMTIGANLNSELENRDGDEKP